MAKKGSQPARSNARILLGSWLFEGIGWFAIAETLARAVSEGIVILVLWAAGGSVVEITVGWLAYHTLAWFLLYGGYAKIRSVMQASAPMERLLSYRDHVATVVRNSHAIRVGLICGSAARGQMTTRSDVDLIVVPERPRIRGVLFTWGLRLDSVVRRMPLGAYILDLERYLPLRLKNQATIRLKSAPPAPKGRERLASEGILVTISGIDGSGKTTVAQDVVRRLRERGMNAIYFYGHRPVYREEIRSLSPALIFKSLWRRLGRPIDDLHAYPVAKLLLDVLTLVDYVSVQARLARRMRAGAVVVVDRYAVDVIVYLRSFGPGHQSVEGLLTGISLPADVALLFEIDPKRAWERKGEEPFAALERVAREYDELAPVYGLARIDANGSEPEVCAAVMRVIDSYLTPDTMVITP